MCLTGTSRSTAGQFTCMEQQARIYKTDTFGEHVREDLTFQMSCSGFTQSTQMTTRRLGRPGYHSSLPSSPCTHTDSCALACALSRSCSHCSSVPSLAEWLQYYCPLPKPPKQQHHQQQRGPKSSPAAHSRGSQADQQQREKERERREKERRQKEAEERERARREREAEERERARREKEAEERERARREREAEERERARKEREAEERERARREREEEERERARNDNGVYVYM